MKLEIFHKILIYHTNFRQLFPLFGIYPNFSKKKSLTIMINYDKKINKIFYYILTIVFAF
jgi:hypothetical protein